MGETVKRSVISQMLKAPWLVMGILILMTYMLTACKTSLQKGNELVNTSPPATMTTSEAAPSTIHHSRTRQPPFTEASKTIFVPTSTSAPILPSHATIVPSLMSSPSVTIVPSVTAIAPTMEWSISTPKAPVVYETTMTLMTYGYTQALQPSRPSDPIYPYPRLDFSQVGPPTPLGIFI
jgi:hypothetical protein